MSSETLEDLKITREEFDRITDAMKQEEFRKLFIEYCEEISDPENRKKYEEEINQLESQRGVDCKFVHPHPGFVVKTTNGTEKVFINIAMNELVDRPSYENSCNDEGKAGMNWSIPLIQAPVRKDMDKKNQWCLSYDVIFHPETLKIAERDSRFRQMVVQTALDAVQNAFKVDLDTTNLRFPKMSYKGMAKPTVIRKKKDEETDTVDMEPLTDIMPPMPEKKQKVVHQVKEEPVTPEYRTPKYTIKYRKKLEMHEFTEQIDAKINSSVPNEMVIEIHLPLLRSASDVVLDVSRTRLFLCSSSPAKYQLELKLSYEVDDKEGNACFNKEKRVLSVTLLILGKNIGVHEIETNQKPKVEVLSESFCDEKEGEDHVNETLSEKLPTFFNSSCVYETPEFHIASYEKDNVRIIIDTPNICPDSIFNETNDGQCHLKFESLGDGYFPVAYGTVIDFDDSIKSSTFTMTDEGMMLVELKLAGNVRKDQLFHYGAPGIEMNRYRVEEKHDPTKIVTVPVIETTDPIKQTLMEFESLKNLKLEG